CRRPRRLRAPKHRNHNQNLSWNPNQCPQQNRESLFELIAESEGVDERQIYLSISHCETRLPRAEVMTNRNFRNAMVAQRKLAEKYVDTVSDLLDGKAGKNWHQRSKALEHFRRTVGAEMGAGVSLQVTQQVGVVNSERPCSFEEMMDRVRKKLLAEQRERQIAAEEDS